MTKNRRGAGPGRPQSRETQEPQTRETSETPKVPFEVLVGMTYPSDPAIVARIRRGDNVPMESRKLKRVEAGTVVDDIPESSVAALLAAGHIKVAAPARAPAARFSVEPAGGAPEPAPEPGEED